MRELVVSMAVSLDGYVADRHGGLEWMGPGIDAELKACLVDGLWRAGVHVMGRVTYEAMAEVWPTSTDDYAPPMNEIPKVVFSSTRRGPAQWRGTQFTGEDLAAGIARLKSEQGKEIFAHGGARFVQSLSAMGLVDEYRLRIHPVALGAGLPLFAAVPAALRLRLVSSRTFGTGVAMNVYRPA